MIQNKSQSSFNGLSDFTWVNSRYYFSPFLGSNHTSLFNFLEQKGEASASGFFKFVHPLLYVFLPCAHMACSITSIPVICSNITSLVTPFTLTPVKITISFLYLYSSPCPFFIFLPSSDQHLMYSIYFTCLFSFCLLPLEYKFLKVRHLCFVHCHILGGFNTVLGT